MSAAPPPGDITSTLSDCIAFQAGGGGGGCAPAAADENARRNSCRNETVKFTKFVGSLRRFFFFTFPCRHEMAQIK